MISAVAGVGLLMAIVVGPAVAGAGGVQRYQVATTSYTIAVLDTFIHTFVVATSPCDGSIAITGSTPLDSGYYTIETVTGTLANDVVSFSSTYVGPYNPGFMWSGSFPVAGGPLSGDFTGTVTASATTLSTYKNHGDFVSSMGGGPEAAHSCIGKPITSKDDTLSDEDSERAESDAAESDNAKDKTAQQARLVETLEGVVAKLHNPHAIDAVQKHIDRIKGAGPTVGAQAANGDHPKNPKHPKKPATGQNHSNNGDHSGKP
jgi:hypothetical protein